MALTVQRHGRLFGIRIRHTVQADLIRDISDLVGQVCGFFGDLKWLAGGLMTLRLMIDGLGEIALEYFHDTVGVGMVVNEGTFARIPNDQELFADLAVEISEW